MKLTGIYHILAELPIWSIAAILIAITMMAIFIVGEVFRGNPYNVAYSAVIGDAGLVIGVLVASTMLQKGEVTIPGFLQSTTTQLFLFVASVMSGIIFCFVTLKSRSGQSQDIYHDAVIVPAFLFLGVTLVPVVYYNGTKIEKIVFACSVMLWVCLVIIDIRYRRMDQSSWLKRHGVAFTNK